MEFNFKRATAVDGILAFMEDTKSPDYLSLHLEREQLVFEYSNGDEVIRTVSPAILCSGCWFRAVATRYMFKLHFYPNKIWDQFLNLAVLYRYKNSYVYCLLKLKNTLSGHICMCAHTHTHIM